MKSKNHILFFILILCLDISAQDINFDDKQGKLRIYPIDEHVIRIIIGDKEKLEIDKHNSSPVLNECCNNLFDFDRERSEFQSSAHEISIRFLQSSSTLVFEDNEGKAIQKIQFDETKERIFFETGDKGLFGLGQEGMAYNRENSFIKMEPGTFTGEIELFGSRVPIPFLISPEGWGLFVHQPYYPKFDLRSPSASFLVQPSDSLVADFFLIFHEDPKKILSEYHRLTGSSPLPPKWSLGYMQSHRTLAGPEEVLQVATKLREKKLPCDALIYLGTGYTPSGWNRGHGSFEFNPEVFPEPKKQLNQLKSMHFKTVFHVLRPPQNLHGYFSDPNVLPADTGHIQNYWVKHKPLLQLGINGFWPDIGDQLSVDAKLARHRMYFEGPLSDNQNIRPFSLHRTGYSGMQRYGGWVWSGDVYSTWETLKEQIALGINWSVSGSSFWGTDIGGFVGTPEYSGELYVRWFQFAAFCPSFRSHGRNWHLHTPWGWNTGKIGHVENKNDTKGVGLPPEEELYNEDVEPVCRKYLELRYQLLPYNYTLAWQAHKQGLPMIRAMWLYYPEDENAIHADDQYFWGENILVAPVYEEDATNRKIYLPGGAWYDYWTNRKYRGHQVINRFVGLEDMPIYIKSGSIIPVAPVRQYVDQQVNDPMKIFIYTGDNGTYQLYEDDGTTLNYVNGKFHLTDFHWDDEKRKLTISSAHVSEEFNKGKKQMQIILIPGLEEKEVVYEHKVQSVEF
jgi:alpha-glucosidase/alpha-D-xyloside xylohydrolase